MGEEEEERYHLNDVLHRLDGPAIELSSGNKAWVLYGAKIVHPDAFKNMEEWIEALNNNEKYSLQWISDINGIILFIKNPTDKQTRLHAMCWKI